ncbi:CDP-glycerol glycerophosphotransferase family protein [Cellulomonas rhizosphaerae]|uniref:Glycosyl transferase n=1 Tax=Cellulomonas rhizosphaerae TaxID=2293719 RepID=A0A413RJP0_9CELL|nr:CDP-glycerol glycerophosphotransferase family protein [Cellulomonas rhizosphaerae]RHA38889.1 glycosyl transferase [Cellulomonas rhizosphaerae]
MTEETSGTIKGEGEAGTDPVVATTASSVPFWRRVLGAGFWPVLVNASAVACALVTIAGGSTGLALTLAGFSVLGVLSRIRWKGVLSRTQASPLGAWTTATSSLLLAVASATSRHDVGDLVWVALVAVLVSVVVGPTLRAADNAGFPVALNLPGADVRATAAFPLGLVYISALLALGALAARLAWPGAWNAVSVVLAGITVIATFACAVDTFLRVRTRRAVEVRLPELLAAYDPAFALHWQAPAGTAYQAAMWLPYLERLGPPWFVLVRTTTNLHDVRGLTSAPIVLRKALEDLDPVVVPSLRAVFYVNTAVRNSHMVRYSHLTHVQLNHGDSDKAPSFNPVFRMYDRDFVAGQAAIDRFAANGVYMPEQLFTIVGRPQVEDVAVARGPIAQVTGPTVLYAPTWSGFYADSDYSSLRNGAALVEALLAHGCTVIFRPHPYSRRDAALAAQCDAIYALLTADTARAGRAHLHGAQAERTMSIVDCFNASDALVSDVSSVVNDYLYSEKPFAMVAVSEPASTFRASFPVAAAAYVLDGHDGLTGADEVLQSMLSLDPLQAQRRALKTYYLGDIPAEHYADRFLAEARAVLGPAPSSQE